MYLNENKKKILNKIKNVAEFILYAHVYICTQLKHTFQFVPDISRNEYKLYFYPHAFISHLKKTKNAQKCKNYFSIFQSFIT